MKDLKNILIIEDNPPDAELVTLLINEISDEYAIRYSTDGGEVMKALKSGAEKLDYILLDLNIPKFNGLEVLRVIKQSPEFHQSKVLIISGSDDQNSMNACKKLKADGYIVKSSQLDAMKNQLQYHLT